MSQAQQKQPGVQNNEWMYEEVQEGPVTRTVYAEKRTVQFRTGGPQTAYREPEHSISLPEAGSYLDLMETAAAKTANGVGMCILSPALLMSLLSLTERNAVSMSEDLAAVIGIAALLAIVAAAVFQFIQAGVVSAQAAKLVKPTYYRSGEVMEFAHAMDDRRNLTLSKRLALGIVLCVFSMAPLIICGAAGADDGIILAMVTVLLGMVAIGVRGIVYSATVMGSTIPLKKNRY